MGRSWLHLPDGSSPLARGTLVVGGRRTGRQRFIPAGAGNTGDRDTERPPSSVHPRWRGEHPEPHEQIAGRAGSSPLARGTHKFGQREVFSQRFIPAGAGNTPARFFPSPALSVHPRWRGEHLRAKKARANNNGSSPLARGTRPRSARPARNQRFIPAGAGNTDAVAVCRHPFTVHPRWRGEHRALLPELCL